MVLCPLIWAHHIATHTGDKDMRIIISKAGGVTFLTQKREFCVFIANTLFARNKRCIVVLGIGFALNRIQEIKGYE